MENQEREAAIDGLEDDGLELSLGLRPAPARCRRVRFPNPTIPAEKPVEIAVCESSGDLSLTAPILGKSGSESEKEAQAARRREAMKKRKSKANAMNEASSERHRKRNGVESAVSTTASFLPGLPYLLMPGLVGGDKKGFQPAVDVGATGGDGSRPNLDVEKNSGGGGNNVKRSVSSCSRGSSPGVSDYQSTSGQGGSSSDGGSHSSRSRPLDQTTVDGPTPSNTEPCQTLKKAPSPCDLELNSGEKPMSNKAEGPPDPSTEQGGEAHLLSQMPCVSTTGNGPNGKTITGFLYRYTKSEVSIVCVCHGTAFSPAGFVEHAGGVDVENPLRRITVVPFALS